MKTLRNLKIGERGRIAAVGGEGELRQHFLDMGLIPGADVEMIKLAPMGDPMEIMIHGYELTLRMDDAARIDVEPLREGELPEAETKASADMETEHPGLGEGGRYHVEADADPLPDDQVLTFALAGNQNCGKTTLFNQLTGSNQHVGNFPGVTVDQKSGPIRGNSMTKVVDLPGIYSLSPYSSEELVSRKFILEEHPTGIINIVDATNIERNLYLTMQLMELNVPMVLALNMMDEVQGNGGSIDINRMEDMLGIPVVPISAAKNQGIDELIAHALHVAKNQERPGRQDFCREDENGGAVHRCLHSIMHLVEDHAKAAGLPIRFAATKLVEGDERVMNALSLDVNEKQTIAHIIRQMEDERGLDATAAIADMRFAFIQKTGPDSDRTVHGYSCLHRHHGNGVLAHVQCDRCEAAGSGGSGDRRPGTRSCRSHDGGSCFSGDPVAGHRRHLRGCGKRPEFCADYRHPVLLPVSAGGQRIYGPGGFRDG